MTPQAAAPVYVVKVYDQYPEDRWFYRHILRREWRRVVIFEGVPACLTIDRRFDPIVNYVKIEAPWR